MPLQTAFCIGRFTEFGQGRRITPVRRIGGLVPGAYSDIGWDRRRREIAPELVVMAPDALPNPHFGLAGQGIRAAKVYMNSFIQ